MGSPEGEPCRINIPGLNEETIHEVTFTHAFEFGEGGSHRCGVPLAHGRRPVGGVELWRRLSRRPCHVGRGRGLLRCALPAYGEI